MPRLTSLIMFKTFSQIIQRFSLLLSLFSLLGLVACGNLPVSLSFSPLLNKNLITNSDAESGQGSSDRNTLVAIPGWTQWRLNQSNVLRYSNGEEVNMMSVHNAGPTSRGNNYFSGGPSDDSLSVLEQAIDLSAISDQIKSGTIRFTLSAYLGGYANRSDYALVTMDFLDAKGHMIRGVAIGPVSAADRHNQTGMMFRNRTGLLPVNTQKIGITLEFFKATNLEGPGNTACADNLSMILASQ